MNDEDRVLDWRPNHDPKSMCPEHRVFPRGATAAAVYMSRFYSTPLPVLDQKSEGACVGHGVVNALRTHPGIRLRVRQTQQLAFGMYYGSRRIDEWEGEDYSGTSVNAGMKLARELGLLAEWQWCKGAAEVRDAILTGKGPVVIGIHWKQSMYRTKPSGLVVTTGQTVGGHCLMVNGYSSAATKDGYTGPLFRWQNSWGEGYGVKGHGYIPFDALGALLAEDGEAAVIAA